MGAHKRRKFCPFKPAASWGRCDRAHPNSRQQIENCCGEKHLQKKRVNSAARHPKRHGRPFPRDRPSDFALVLNLNEPSNPLDCDVKRERHLESGDEDDEREDEEERD